MAQRWRLTLEYDGRDFAGWQLQNDAPTVQGAVERALAAFLGEPVRIAGAGRTDAGVHAAMQVASFVTDVDRRPDRVREGLNHFLPDAIACLDARPVDDAFDPRRSPHTKTYRYTWLSRPARSPLRAGRVWHVRQSLDAEAMHEAVQHLVGTHDFTTFRSVGCSAKHPVRTLLDAAVSRVDDEVHLQMRGTGFLRHMVRIVAGTLREVGRGKRTVDGFAAALAARDRSVAGPTAPPGGLLLAAIVYHDDPA